MTVENVQETDRAKSSARQTDSRDKPLLKCRSGLLDITQSFADVDLAGDKHRRIVGARAQNGDHVMIAFNTTDIVRQRKAAIHARERLVSALNPYPDPIVIYESDLQLV